MDWKLGIPKIMHCYWGGGVMPYMRYMMVKSFIDLNPYWNVHLWLPKHQSEKQTWTSGELGYSVRCEDFFFELTELPVTLHTVDFEDFGLSNRISEVHKSDFLRLFILKHYGGLWSDFDILYFKSMTELAVNKDENKEVECVVSIDHYGHSAGFLMAKPNSLYFSNFESFARLEYHPEIYQCMGTDMYNKYYPTLKSISEISSVVNIGMDAVYAHDAMNIPYIINGTVPKFTKDSIGLHWYAGHRAWGKFINDTNGGLINLPNSIIGNVLRNYER